MQKNEEKIKYTLNSILKKIVNKFSANIGTDNEKNRAEWIQLTLNAVPRGESILDVGAGWLRNKQYCTHLIYKSQDFCQYDGVGDGVALQNGSWDTSKIDIVSDITNIPIDDQSFDNVLCSEVLEHVPDSVAALKELTRILKKNGRLILTAPFLMPTHQAPYYFTSGFSRYWYIHHLKQLGCEIHEIKTNGDFYSLLAQELRRFPFIFSQINKSRLTILIFSIVCMLLIFLNKIKKNSAQSSDISAYGYFVIAIKK
jgi:SAM-dependent methyltransferase